MYNKITMIYTLTFNPSLDYILELDKEFEKNSVNRVRTSNIFPGGKGINCSLILNKLGEKNKAIVFLDNDFGKIIENKLNDNKIDYINFKTESITRINVKVNTDKQNFEINGSRIVLENSQQNMLIEYLTKNLKEEDVLMIMGSLSNNDESFFESILKIVKNKKAELVFDIDSKKLLSFLKYEPLLIKPNRTEIESLFDKKIKDKEIINYGEKLREMGAKNVLVSMGSEGSVLLADNNKKYRANPIKIDMINPVGAGDSTIAGFISSYIKKRDYVDALKLGSACGTATANNEWLGSNEDIEKFYNEIIIENIN